MSEQILILTVGLPRSGKSSWARDQGLPIVNPDSIRLALHGQAFIGQAEPFVWAIAKCMVRSLFLAGNNTVILDATNTTMKRRDEWTCQREWKTVFVPFNASSDECKDRAIKSSREDLIPIIERMSIQFEPLQPEDEIWWQHKSAN